MILNGVMAVILCYFSEFGSFRGALRKSGYRVFHRIFEYNVDVKQLLGLPRFQNLLLIVYDHIKTICAIIQPLFGQNRLITWFDGRRCIGN